MTDAALVLGYFNPNGLLVGGLSLNATGAREGSCEQIVDPLDIGPHRGGKGRLRRGDGLDRGHHPGDKGPEGARLPDIHNIRYDDADLSDGIWRAIDCADRFGDEDGGIEITAEMTVDGEGFSILEPADQLKKSFNNTDGDAINKFYFQIVTNLGQESNGGLYELLSVLTPERSIFEPLPCCAPVREGSRVHWRGRAALAGPRLCPGGFERDCL